MQAKHQAHLIRAPLPSALGIESMKLINHYLPEYQFAEEHSRYIPALPARVLDVIGHPDVVDDPIARVLIALREMPNRLAGRLGFA
jgi:hypothetical protein